jgi:hypothetical protein
VVLLRNRGPEMDDERKLRTHEALKERDIRIASLIVEGFQNTANLLDAQCPTVLEPLVAYAKELRKTEIGIPEHRKKLRDALIEYGEHALREAHGRERRLYQGITGKNE